VRILLVVLGALAVVGSGSPGPRVETVYRSSSRIAAFAQDDDVLAWVSAGHRTCNAVHLLSLKGVKTTLPKPGTDNVTCRWNLAGGPVQLAIAADAGDAALWTLHQRAQVALDYVVGATFRQPLERRFTEIAHTPRGAGLWLGGIAGSGSTLVYATTEIAYVDQVDCLSGGSCALKVAGGGVHRIVGRSDTLLPHTGPTVDVAAAAGRIATIPAATVAPNGTPQASLAEAVEVRDAATGTLLAQVLPDDVPVAVALAPHVLAVLERGDGRTRLAWYDPDAGRLLGAERVPPQTSVGIVANDGLIVFRVGRTIRAVDVSTGTLRTLAKAAATPIGLSLADTRLAWAENVGGVGRIRALELG
jgi:hypothetical protein